MLRFQRSDSSPTPPNTHLADEPHEVPGPPLKPTEVDDLRQLISLNEAHRYLPCRQAGKKIHRTTLGRWASKGCRGVVLKTWLVGGVRYTNLDALDEFVKHLGALSELVRRTTSTSPVINSTSTNPTSTSHRTIVSDSRRYRIEKDLDLFGV